MRFNSLSAAITGTILLVAPPTGHRRVVTAQATDSGKTIPTLVVSIQGLNEGPQVQASWGFTRDSVARVAVGAGSADVPQLCGVSGGGLDFQPGTRVGWLIEARLLAVDVDGARVSIRWSRVVMDSSAIEGGNLSREFETHLSEGVRNVVDLVRPVDETAGTCDGVAVQIWLDFSDSRELANRLLEYDIWLIHQEADGREVLDRSSGRGLQGKRVDYLFRTLQYDFKGTPQLDGEVKVDMRGSVKGRVRPDGRIDLLVQASRVTTERSLGNGDGGAKQATVEDGETVEFELPPHRGREPAFTAQRSSVRVTVRRLS